MFFEKYVRWQKTISYTISRINNAKTLLVFFHGVGDAHVNYRCFFEASALKPYDLFVADLLGHGRSSIANQYDFAYQCEVIYQALQDLIGNYDQIIFVPHSMGGIHATLLAKHQLSAVVSGIFAVETSITQFGSFIAKQVTDIVDRDESFQIWFNDFLDKVYTQMGASDQVLRQYFAGLQFVRPEAFKKNCLEMYELATSFQDEAFTNKIGHEFVSLAIPKVYCLGQRKTNQGNRAFLEKYQIPKIEFPTESHWVAQTCLSQFCDELSVFVERLN